MVQGCADVGASSRAGGRTRLRLGGWTRARAGREACVYRTTRRFHRENDLCFFEELTLLQLFTLSYYFQGLQLL